MPPRHVSTSCPTSHHQLRQTPCPGIPGARGAEPCSRAGGGAAERPRLPSPCGRAAPAPPPQRARGPLSGAGMPGVGRRGTVVGSRSRGRALNLAVPSRPEPLRRPLAATPAAGQPPAGSLRGEPATESRFARRTKGANGSGPRLREVSC